MLENITLKVGMTSPPDFNWLAILKDLVAGAPIKDYEHQKLVALAFEWPTCACGQLCKALPRTPSGAPVDGVLKNLGAFFAAAIEDGRWEAALGFFYQIEARTDRLLKLQEKETLTC